VSAYTVSSRYGYMLVFKLSWILILLTHLCMQMSKCRVFMLVVLCLIQEIQVNDASSENTLNISIDQLCVFHYTCIQPLPDILSMQRSVCNMWLIKDLFSWR
jgi:hypothetical protein